MADQPPNADNRAVPDFFDIVAGSFVLVALETGVVHKEPPAVWGSCLAAGIAFSVAGRFSTQILAALGNRGGEILEWVVRYTWLIVLAVAAYVVLTQPDRYRYFALGGATAYFLLSGLSYVRALRRDLDRYVMPRRLSSAQERRLRSFLNGAPKHSITVNANPQDREAIEYAGRLHNAFQQSGWDVQFNTAPPYDLNEGLRINAMGINNVPKNEPRQTIQQAFTFARIECSGGGAGGAGEFKVTIAVGPRPLAIYRSRGLLMKIGNSITRLGRQG
jgi:hypothetical protein